MYSLLSDTVKAPETPDTEDAITTDDLKQLQIIHKKLRNWLAKEKAKESESWFAEASVCTFATETLTKDQSIEHRPEPEPEPEPELE